MQQRGWAVPEEVNGAASSQIPGRSDHPDREVVVRDVQFHRALEQPNDGRVETGAGEELEPRTEGSVVKTRTSWRMSGSGSSVSSESRR